MRLTTKPTYDYETDYTKFQNGMLTTDGMFRRLDLHHIDVELSHKESLIRENDVITLHEQYFFPNRDGYRERLLLDKVKRLFAQGKQPEPTETLTEWTLREAEL